MNLANIILKRLGDCNDKVYTTVNSEVANTIETSEQQKDSHLVAVITSKLKAGNFHAAIRLLCSEDKPASNNAETLEALQAKHPPATKIVNPRMTLWEMLDFSHFKSHRKISLNVLKLSQPAHLVIWTASRRSIFATF